MVPSKNPLLTVSNGQFASLKIGGGGNALTPRPLPLSLAPLPNSLVICLLFGQPMFLGCNVSQWNSSRFFQDFDPFSDIAEIERCLKSAHCIIMDFIDLQHLGQTFDVSSDEIEE